MYAFNQSKKGMWFNIIEFLKNWIEQIAVAVVIVSIFELILPKGNLKKYIKVVLGTYIIFCMISPFVNSANLFDINQLDFNEIVDNSSKTITNSSQTIDARLQELYIEEIKKSIEEKVKEYGFEIYKSKIDADLSKESKNPGIHKINLILKRKNIGVDKIDIRNDNDKKENEAIIDNIKNEIANMYNIQSDIISIQIK